MSLYENLRLDHGLGKNSSDSFGLGRLVAVMVLAVSLVFVVFCGQSANCQTAHASSVPSPSLIVPPMVPEKSVSTYLPSESAPGTGIAVNVIFPKYPRYIEGAPVVVVVPGNGVASGLEFSMHASQAGFAEVRFAFPGGGTKGFASGGIYDNRGLQSQVALKDVLLFAAGKKADVKGRFIKDLLKTVKVPLYNKTIGLVGWSNGGNILLVTLAKYANDLKFVGWLAFYESPLGELFMPGNLGSTADFSINKHYRQGSCATGTCLVDYRKLCWQAQGIKNPGSHKKAGEPEIEGVLFFDENKNKVWDEGSEYALAYTTDIGLDKQIYAPDILKACRRWYVFGSNWPETICTLEEAQAFYHERDGSKHIKEVCEKLPELMVTIYGSRIDHYQRQPDHPHIALAYNAFSAGKLKFLRLNPDPWYVNQISDLHSGNFANNKPGAAIDADDIDSNLEGEGLLPDYVYIDACIAELSDRKKAKNYSPNLAAPITIYTNGAKSPAPAKKTEK
jgi:hypothetical protein